MRCAGKMWRCVIVVVLSTYGADVDLLFCGARALTPERVAEIRAWSMTFCMCMWVHVNAHICWVETNKTEFFNRFFVFYF